MRSTKMLLTVLAAGFLICGFAAAANAQAFLGFDQNIGVPNPGYPPQYYKAGNTSGPGWIKMGGGAEFKGYVGNDQGQAYPPAYTKAQNPATAGWVNMKGGSDFKGYVGNDQGQAYPPAYTKAQNPATAGWITLGGSK